MATRGDADVGVDVEVRGVNGDCGVNGRCDGGDGSRGGGDCGGNQVDGDHGRVRAGAVGLAVGLACL